jgi:hypothetical protein
VQRADVARRLQQHCGSGATCPTTAVWRPRSHRSSTPVVHGATPPRPAAWPGLAYSSQRLTSCISTSVRLRGGLSSLATAMALRPEDNGTFAMCSYFRTVKIRGLCCDKGRETPLQLGCRRGLQIEPDGGAEEENEG